MQKSQKKTFAKPLSSAKSCDKPVPSGADTPIDNFAVVNFLTVSSHQDGQRLDNFLLARLKGLPRSHLYKLIRDGEVRLNKKRCKPHQRLAKDDIVRIPPIRLTTKEMPTISPDFAKRLLTAIVYEDDGLLVVDKPSGLAVHGGSGVNVGLIEALRIALQKPYLELVHRIDRDTSGLVMIAKKRSTLKKLQDLLREHKIQKTYLALVKGEVAKDCQLIDAPLLRYELANGERRVRVSKDGKMSQTRWTVLQRFKGVTLVQAMPLSGRTHQIRVHGLSIGHPLLGDDKYGHQIPSTIAAERLYLHALRLEIPDYPVIEAAVPCAFNTLIASLKANADKT